MVRFELEVTDEILPTQSGLALLGLLISKTKLTKRLNKLPTDTGVKPEIPNSDIAKAYLGLLVQGKTDYDHIEAFRDDPFFTKGLDMEKVPSSPTLRQRLDSAEGSWKEMLLEESARLIKRAGVPITPCKDDYLPVDIDVSPLDNSGSHKEGVSLTYKKYDGYSPIFAYLGVEGYGINVELREGKTHCQNGTPKFLRETIDYAKRITNKPLLFRLDSGNDSLENIELFKEAGVDWIIKRNLRHESKEDWLELAKEEGESSSPHPGRKTYLGKTKLDKEELEELLQVVYQVTEEKTDSDGQMLLSPNLEVDTYWCSLDISPQEVVKLYQNHGTSEQFHSEIKGELDLERLPSGKFATNDLILHLGLFSYNVLRLVGQESLKRDDLPLRKKVQRRRIKTVIGNLVNLASKFVRHARKYKLRFSRTNPWHGPFRRIYLAFDSI
jgi:hypothetical protein